MTAELDEELFAGAAESAIAHRRYLHENPELSFNEVNTSSYVRSHLESIGNLAISRPTKTSVTARLKGALPGPVRAFRADMDALPIQEENELPYTSRHDGVMHACGHDGHTAMLLATAELLAPMRDEIGGEVVFIFQHAEELPPGGAAEIVATGVLDDVDYIVGTHLMSTLDTGKFEIIPGYAMAACHEFTITISGNGGHASRPHESTDCVLVAAEIVTNLQTIVSRRIDPMKSAVVTIPIFNGGTADNVFPESVTLGGTVRVFDAELQEKIPALIEQVIKGLTYAHGATCMIDYNKNYGAVYNNPRLTRDITQLLEDQFGADALSASEPSMGSEDFSAYGQIAPAGFIHIGARNKSKGSDYPHHHPRFNIDEDALVAGVKIFCKLAFSDFRNADRA